MSRLKLAIALYTAAAVVTFGHAASHFSGCYLDGKPTPCMTDQRAIGGFIAAMFMPLYWSWTAWDAAQ